VLTILGYSLYDTVIVFDRIRENAPKIGTRSTYGAMVNRSIWETLTRSINTTLMTLFPVLALLLFGGVTLKDFAFALFIGVMSGAYSSIFVASPFACWLKEREPQYRRLATRDAKS
jgi:SecD/SecF fusion protein